MSKGVCTPIPLTTREEHSCTRWFKASFWSRGVEDPCITYQVFGSNAHLYSIKSHEPKSPAQDEEPFL